MSLYDRFEDFRTINSEEEERLRVLADRDRSSRREYVEYHKREMPEYHDTGLRMISEVLGKYDKPNYCPFGEWSVDNKELVEDMLYSLHRFGAPYVEYLQFDFARRTPASRDSFATLYRNINAYKVLNSPEGTAICEDKYRSYERFGKYYRREVRFFPEWNDRASSSVRRMVQQHGSVMVKPADQMQGKGIFRIDGSRAEAISSLDLTCRGGVVVEQAISNSSELRKLHPESLNTVRVETLLFPDKVEFLTPFIRMGRGGSVVDNGGAGGIFANIDLYEGVVATFATDEWGSRFIRHPDTGVCIPGLEIPGWHELLSLSEHLAVSFPECKAAAWDFALTDEGWALVEVNHNGHTMMQIADGVGVWDRFVGLMRAWE